jgi:hypothetical protein
VARVLRDAGVSADPLGPTGDLFAIAGETRNVVLLVEPARIVVGWADERVVDDDEDDDPDERVREIASGAVQALQLATRCAVDGDDVDGCEPAPPCAACGAALFEEEEACFRCGAEVPEDPEWPAQQPRAPEPRRVAPVRLVHPDGSTWAAVPDGLAVVVRITRGGKTTERRKTFRDLDALAAFVGEGERQMQGVGYRPA